VDELIDVSKHAILLLYMRFIDYYREDIREGMLRCLALKALKTYTTSVLNEFFMKKGLQWKCHISIYTDGGAQMTGHH
jgi:hypothetical protein